RGFFNVPLERSSGSIGAAPWNAACAADGAEEDPLPSRRAVLVRLYGFARGFARLERRQPDRHQLRRAPDDGCHRRLHTDSKRSTRHVARMGSAESRVLEEPIQGARLGSLLYPRLRAGPLGPSRYRQRRPGPRHDGLHRPRDYAARRLRDDAPRGLSRQEGHHESRARKESGNGESSASAPESPTERRQHDAHRAAVIPRNGHELQVDSRMQRRRPRRGQPGRRPPGAPVPLVSPHRIQILAALLAAATVLVYVAHAAYFRHYVNDDAYITFRYSRFLTLGRGPYFNVGEHVEGYTNPLFVLLMVPIIAFGGEAAASIGAKTIGVLCGALSLVAAFILSLRLDGGEDKDGDWYWLGGVLAAGLIAVSPSYALRSMSGVGRTLFGLCITAGVLLRTIGAQRGAWYGAGVAFAAGVLTRPEGIALFAVYWWPQCASTL